MPSVAGSGADTRSRTGCKPKRKSIDTCMAMRGLSASTAEPSRRELSLLVDGASTAFTLPHVGARETCLVSMNSVAFSDLGCQASLTR